MKFSHFSVGVDTRRMMINYVLLRPGKIPKKTLAPLGRQCNILCLFYVHAGFGFVFLAFSRDCVAGSANPDLGYFALSQAELPLDANPFF